MKSEKPGVRGFWRDRSGSLTVEGTILIPALFLLMAVFARLGVFMKDEIQKTADEGAAVGQGSDAKGGIGFLIRSNPARRIRDTDLLIDVGSTLIDKIPEWFDKGDSK